MPRPFRVYRPRIALRTHIFLITLALGIAAAVIAFGLHQSLPARALEAGVFTAVMMTSYYGHLLYRGVRYDHGRLGMSLRTVPLSEVSFDAVPDVSSALPDIPLPDGEGGCLGAVLLGLAISLVVILVPVLVWLAANAVLIGGFLIAVPLYAALRYGFRVALSNGRRCYGNLGRSLAIGGLHAVFAGCLVGGALYTAGWVLARVG